MNWPWFSPEIVNIRFMNIEIITKNIYNKDIEDHRAYNKFSNNVFIGHLGLSDYWMVLVPSECKRFQRYSWTDLYRFSMCIEANFWKNYTKLLRRIHWSTNVLVSFKMPKKKKRLKNAVELEISLAAPSRLARYRCEDNITLKNINEDNTD